MYAAVMATRENFRFRLAPALKSNWTEFCASRLASQQKVLEAMIAWFLSRPPQEQDEIIRQGAMLVRKPKLSRGEGPGYRWLDDQSAPQVKRR